MLNRFIAAAFLSVFIFEPSLAQSPFGVGLPEANAPSTSGYFAEFFAYIREQQSAFYGQLTSSLKTMKEDGSAVWFLMLVSFLYGIFHAAGPGHGKVVLSSYVLANRETAKKGALLCLIASLVQAISAVAIISVLAIFLKFTSIFITELTQWISIASFALVTLLGAYLLWRALKPLLKKQSHHHGHHHDHDHAHCNHDHAPPLETAAKGLRTKEAWAAILSVGIRPCTGALIVLTFAYANELYWAGVLSAFVMGIGTAITTSAIMLIATTGRTALLNLSGGSEKMAHYGMIGLQIAGALMLILMGAALLLASI